jgi:hypothetical protein
MPLHLLPPVAVTQDSYEVHLYLGNREGRRYCMGRPTCITATGGGAPCNTICGNLCDSLGDTLCDSLGDTLCDTLGDTLCDSLCDTLCGNLCDTLGDTLNPSSNKRRIAA